jgi:hypothetical protein
MANKFNTPLLVYGENVSYEYGGSDNFESYSARSILENGVASDVDVDDLVKQTGVDPKSLELTNAPSKENLVKLDPMYVSYFIPWNSFRNYQFAKKRGFKDLTHEWDRTHNIESFDQIDSAAYLVHSWMKYPKFGHASATDYASRFIRYGLLTREKGVELVNQFDHNLDPLCVDQFCDFLGITTTKFWTIIEGFYNTNLFYKDNYGQWKLKSPLK